MIIDGSAILAIFFRGSCAEALLSVILEADCFQETAIEIVPYRSSLRAILAYARFGKGRHPFGLGLP